MPISKLYFATDLHGSEKCYIKFLNAAKFYKVNTLILGGDITGKVIIPIVKRPDGCHSAHFLDSDHVAKSEAELDQMISSIQVNGYYPYETTEAEADELMADKKKSYEVFNELMIGQIKRWLNMAEERLKGTGVKVYMTGGNDDRFEIEPVLKSSSFVTDAEGEVLEIDSNHEMISTGYGNKTPWNCPRDVSEEELAKRIEDMTSKVRRMENCIFNIHVPPVNSGIDEAPLLDASVSPPKPVVKGGQVMKTGAGSRAVREAIEKSQPLLGLHGHIHESRGVLKIGRTTCLNPGSEYTEGTLHGVIVAFDEKSIKSHQLVSG
jgi:uncharacterized protein